MDVDVNWTEKLISAVESQPLLYNKAFKEYSERDLKIKAWTEVKLYRQSFLWSMAVVDKIARAHVQKLAELYTENSPFYDVKVRVQGTTFKCHRFLLGAVSDYFKGLFTSGMQEALKKEVNLGGMSENIFKLILDFIYRSCNILTPENSINVWHAATQLQMSVLLGECEEFQESRLVKSNCVDIYLHAKMLNSRKLLSLAKNLIVSEFGEICKTDSLMELEFDDLVDVISQDDLNVQSEDMVIKTILQWAAYDVINPWNLDDEEETFTKFSRPTTDFHTSTETSGTTEQGDTTHLPRDDREDNKRIRFLPDLLSASRLCLASQPCLMALAQNPAVKADEKAFKIILEGLRYHLDLSHRHAWCSPYGMYRVSSPLKNVIMAISLDTNGVKVTCRTPEGDWYSIAPPPPARLTKFTAVAFNGNVFIESTNKSMPTQCYDTKNCKWLQLNCLNIPRQNHVLVMNGSYVYAIGGDNCVDIERLDTGEIDAMNPLTAKWEKDGQLDQAVSNIEATSFGSCILVFGSLKPDAVMIQCYDTMKNKSFVYLDSLPGPAKNLTTFKTEEETFIVQRNGALWRIKSADHTGLSMQFTEQLWKDDITLHNVLVSNKVLHVFGTPTINLIPSEWDTRENFNFQRIKVIDCHAGYFFHNIIHKDKLVTKA